MVLTRNAETLEIKNIPGQDGIVKAIHGGDEPGSYLLTERCCLTFLMGLKSLVALLEGNSQDQEDMISPSNIPRSRF